MTQVTALFVTREGAARAIIRAVASYGCTDVKVVTRGRVKPIYRRGELRGYHAIYPQQDGTLALVGETTVIRS